MTATTLKIDGHCPSCDEPQKESRASTRTCSSCGLVAPRKAFVFEGQGSSNAADGVRAWTISGRVD